MVAYTKIEFKKRDIQLKDIPKFYQNLMENKVSIGVHKTQGEHNVEKAFWNEFGSTRYLTKDVRKRLSSGRYVTLKAGTIIITPPRPFIRLYLYPEKINKLFKEYNLQISNAFQEGLKPPIRNAKDVLEGVATYGAREMQHIIASNEMLQPNASLTVEIKGFDHPLLNTGKMINAIRGKVSKI